MKTTLMLCAVAIPFGLGIGSAFAGGGQSEPPLFNSIEAQPRSTSVGVPSTSPLFTIGGVEVRVWTPVAPPYNAEANGDLAARDIWGPG
jgi:hypothetical protein